LGCRAQRCNLWDFRITESVYSALIPAALIIGHHFPLLWNCDICRSCLSSTVNGAPDYARIAITRQFFDNSCQTWTPVGRHPRGGPRRGVSFRGRRSGIAAVQKSSKLRPGGRTRYVLVGCDMLAGGPPTTVPIVVDGPISWTGRRRLHQQRLAGTGRADQQQQFSF
jgi:hypothetical protein